MLIPFDELFRKYQIKPNGVLHVGANSGQEAETYQRLGITDVVWIEALPEIYEKLLIHLRGFPTQRAYRGCISDVSDQTVTFHVASNDGQSSSMLEPTQHCIEHPSVKFNRQVELQTIRLDHLLRVAGVQVGPDWFLNLDLQGTELLALKSLGHLIHQFKYAYVEVNNSELYKGCAFVHQIDDFLEPLGFQPRQTRWTGNGWGDRFYSK